jgi:hypothetical protein
MRRGDPALFLAPAIRNLAPMKYTMMLLAFSLCLAQTLNAQQKGKTRHLMVSLHTGLNAYHPQMVVTSDDGSQNVTMATKTSWMWTAQTGDIRPGKLAAWEDSLFLTLKPFYDAGWELVTTNIIKISASDDYIARYFFKKED